MTLQLVVDNTKRIKDTKTALCPQVIETKNRSSKSPLDLINEYISKGNNLLDDFKTQKKSSLLMQCEELFLKAEKLLTDPEISKINRRLFESKYHDFKHEKLKLYYHMGFTEYCGNLINDTTSYDSESLDILLDVQKKTKIIKNSKDHNNFILEAIDTVNKFPKHFASHSNLGMVYKLAGDYENAFVSYRKAESLNPKSGMIKFGLGETMLLMADKKLNGNLKIEYSKIDLDRAKKLFYEAEELGFKNTDLYTYLGGIEYEYGILKENSLPTKNTLASKNKIKSQNNFDNSVTYFENALSMDGSNIRAIDGLFAAYCKLGLISKVDELLYQASRRIKVEDIEYWIILANLFDMWNNDKEKVLECLNRAYKIDSKDPLVAAAFLKFKI